MTSKSMQVIDWMVDEANSTELRLVSILANALYLQAKPPEPFDPVALKQTSGKITSTELAEFLSISPTQKVSEALSQGFKQGSIKGLFREATKATRPDGRVVASYLYWLDGGLK